MYSYDDVNQEWEGEWESEWETDLDDDFDTDAFDDDEWSDRATGPFDEAMEMQLAADLLAASSDEELDQFIGKLFRSVKKAIPSSVRRSLGGQIRGLARRALPMLGAKVGTMFGGPAGGALGRQFASSAGRYFGLELEGLSPEDQEFEVARSVVRLAGDAAAEAAKAPSSMPAKAVASKAMKIASARHAPGLALADLRTSGGATPTGRSGRWVRRGRDIVLRGV